MNAFALAASAALTFASDRSVLEHRPLRLVVPLTIMRPPEQVPASRAAAGPRKMCSSLEPGNVAPNSPQTYSLTVRRRRFAAFRLKQTILMTTKAVYYKMQRLCTSKSTWFNCSEVDIGKLTMIRSLTVLLLAGSRHNWQFPASHHHPRFISPIRFWRRCATASFVYGWVTLCTRVTLRLAPTSPYCAGVTLCTRVNLRLAPTLPYCARATLCARATPRLAPTLPYCSGSHSLQRVQL